MLTLSDFSYRVGIKELVRIYEKDIKKTEGRYKKQTEGKYHDIVSIKKGLSKMYFWCTL